MSINFALFFQHLSKVQLSDGGLGNGSSTLFALEICTVREPVGMLPRGEGGSYLVTNPELAQSLFIYNWYL